MKVAAKGLVSERRSTSLSDAILSCWWVPRYDRVRVRAVSHWRFAYDGPMWAGVIGEMGPSAWLEQEGVHVVVISAGHHPIDLAFCRSSIFNVDRASTLSHDFRRLPYTRLGRKMCPVDLEVNWV